MPHQRTDIERLYIKKKLEELTNKNNIKYQQNNKYGIKEYVDITTDWVQQLINTREVKEKHLVTKAIILLNNLTSHRKKGTGKIMQQRR